MFSTPYFLKFNEEKLIDVFNGVDEIVGVSILTKMSDAPPFGSFFAFMSRTLMVDLLLFFAFAIS